MILKYRRNSSLSFTNSSTNILLKALVYIQFFNHGLTHTLLFHFGFFFVVFLQNMCSISNKLNTWFSFVFIFFPIIVGGGFFLHILYEFYETKLNVMKYTLNRVSWNSLKEIFHSVSSPYETLLRNTYCLPKFLVIRNNLVI